MPTHLTAWLDVSAGAAGDMICGALLDAGAPLEGLQQAVDAVVPGSVRLLARPVRRAGLRATKLDVQVLTPDQPHRPWAAVRELLAGSALPPSVREAASAVFARLAAAEARVHGIPVDEVELHEVGALDSIADLVAACAGLEALGALGALGALDARGIRGAGALRAGPMALGSGHVFGAHGRMPVPVPAVLALVRGWQVLAGGDGELATPTGAAIVTTLATECTPLPALTVSGVGVGAGDRDTPGRANVVRVVLGSPTPGEPATGDGTVVSTEVVVQSNVDDLDPRLWPGVLQRLLEAGASDAWLTPILMKKGRPAHTLSALVTPDLLPAVRQVLLRETSAIGLRETAVTKHALARAWHPVLVAGQSVRVKVATQDGRVVHATPEFDDVAAVAAAVDRPARDVLEEAVAAAVREGLVEGAAAPQQVRRH